MILARIEQYMRDHRRSALTDMAISLDAAPDALRTLHYVAGGQFYATGASVKV